MLSDLALVLLFVVVGGVFAASEIALVSLRESQLTGLARRGRRGRRVAALARDPNRFLSTVQIGVTVAGFFSASYGGVTLAPTVAPTLERWGVPAGAAQITALGAVTLVIAYLSLVLGELVPKRLALQRAEGTSLLVAWPLDVLSRLLRPVIWLLSRSTDLAVRLLGGDPEMHREGVSEEELRHLLSEHEALTEEQRRIVAEVLDAADRTIGEMMVPRTEVDFLPAHLPVAEALQQALRRPRTRYPVVGESTDDVLGFVHARDLTERGLTGTGTVGDLVRRVPRLPESLRVLPALNRLRARRTHLAVVVDEYGGTAGIVTVEDLLEELVGDIWDEFDELSRVRHVAPGTVEIDGLLHVEDLPDAVPGLQLPTGGYDTVGGFVMHRLGRIPQVGDSLTVGDHEMRVVEMDGHRVATVRVARRGRELGEGGSGDDGRAG